MLDAQKLGRVTSNIGDMNLRRRIHTIVNELELKGDDIILDCGCGDGLFLVAISELSSCELHGLDGDERNIRLARNYLNNKAVKLVRGDITDLPYKDEYFDKIYCTEVLEHVSDDEKAVQEMRRVLRKNGTLIVTVPNHNYPFLWDPMNKILEGLTGKHIQGGFWAGIWAMHLRLYKFSEIIQLIEKSGFKIKNSLALTHYCIPFNHVILYGLKRVLLSSILPRRISNTADKFQWAEEEQSTIIRFGYWILNRFDALNDKIPINKSCVNIFIKAEKK